MNPFDRAALYYDVDPGARSLELDILLHFYKGYVISTPSAFLMGRPVVKNANPIYIRDPSFSFQNPDCWHVWLASGDIKEFFKYMPYHLPWVSWERHDVLRYYKTEALRAKLYGISLAESTTSGGTYRVLVPHASAA